MDKLVGRTLAKRYRIVRPIGTGGMGVVFEAVHVDLGRSVALKVLRETDQRALERFHQEALATAKLDSPHIVGVTDFHPGGSGPAFIVMELLAGSSLRELLQRERALATTTAVHIADQLLAALATAHRAGIVHRDVKPPNVFLVPEAPGAPPTIKLLDFGVAKLAAEAGGMKTTVGTVLGTPGYLAPEQIHGIEVDARTDVHAVGLLFYEMLVGRRLWVDARGAELGRAIALEIPPPVIRADVPVELSALIARALAKDPRARFADAAEMRRALRAIPVSRALAELTAPATVREPEPRAVRTADFDEAKTVRMAPRSDADARAIHAAGLAVLVLVAAILALRIATGRAEATADPPPPSASPSASTVRTDEPRPDVTPVVASGIAEARPPATSTPSDAPDARAPALRGRSKAQRGPAPASELLDEVETLPPTPPRPPPRPLPQQRCDFRDPFTGRCL